MIRILSTIFTIIILLPTASLGEIESDIRNMLLSPQEKERLLEEKNILEPVIRRRIKKLREESESKLEKLKKENNDRIQKGEDQLKVLDWYNKRMIEEAKEFSNKCRNVEKPLREIEIKLSMDQKSRELISYSSATPQERMDFELKELRSKVQQQEDELDKLRRKLRRDPLLP